MHSDYVRHNEAVRLGWSILYFMGKDIKDDAIHVTVKYVIDTMNYTQPTPPRETGAELLRRLHGKQ